MTRTPPPVVFSWTAKDSTERSGGEDDRRFRVRGEWFCGTDVIGVLRNELAFAEDGVRLEVFGVVEEAAVRPAGGGDGAEVGSAVVVGGVVRGDHEGGGRVEAHRDGASDDVVDVAVLLEVCGVAVVGAEGDEVRGLGGDDGEECFEVARGGALADENADAEREFFLRLGEGGAFVVGGDAGGGVRLEEWAGEPGCVPVYEAAGEAEVHFVEDIREAEEDSWEVHHLGEGDDAGIVEERREVLGGEVGAGGLEGAGGDTG